ncbi:D-3-phosphoglycerate dehydrogenase [Maribacter vaceletii]|uniref:D-3-phosphoglycerate dehydrogenase n=1 Tax=Maribacter vaceletii TaxID=1206816 RepID=A0A495EAJ9_9FLAO|nr:D-2-hydroxyacid dehydrogenase [Maribacter vaceletii]RKR12887.1 D-3-phosphoglycerate dehydrogenase [Maribacter vaceletii]
MTILANDGISSSGISTLEANGFKVLTTTVAQEQLANYINEQKVSVLLVRSATKVTKEVIDQCSSLKLIGRGGIGLDNIDVAYATKKGVKVINTPEASSISVAELVFAHLLSGSRFLYDANRNMPLEGDSNFKKLKKGYAKGLELRGKTLGIIGFGRIGQETAKIAIGLGMNVLYYDPAVPNSSLEISFFDNQKISFSLTNTPKEEVLKAADFITLHVPSQKEYTINKNDFNSMKNGVGIINTARGGSVDEVALVAALENKKVSFAGLDVFESEPTPEIKILMHPSISLSPHIGASTIEAQDKIGMELAKQIIEIFKA